MQQVSCICGDDTHLFGVQAALTVSFMITPVWHQFYSSLSSSCVFFVFCYSLKWKPLLETFSLTCKVFSHVEVACPKMFCELMTCLVT